MHTPGTSAVIAVTSRLLLSLVLVATGVLGGCAATNDEAAVEDPLSEAPQPELREVFRLGGLEAAPEETFQRTPSLAVDAAGSTYALHRDLGRVAVFDGQGTFIRWIGRGQGEGPGEFTSATRVGFVADTLWIRNFSTPWISLFLTDGTYVDTDRLIVDVDYFSTAGVQGVSGYLRGGRAWMEPDGFIMDDADARAPFVLGDRRMERRDALMDWRGGRGWLAGTIFAPVAEPPFHDVAPDGSMIVVAEWSEERPGDLPIRVVDPDGSERRSRTFTFPSNPLPATVRDSLIERAQEHVGEVRQQVIDQGIPPEHAPGVPSATEVREQVFLPEYYPPIGAVRLGIDGTIWLRRMNGLDEGPWVALDPDGIPLFQVVLPKGSRLRHVARQSVWATETDEYDVPYVVRWEVVAGDDG